MAVIIIIKKTLQIYNHYKLLPPVD